MDMVSYGKFVLAFIFVLGLIGLLALIMRRFGLGIPQAQYRRGQNRRLSIIEVMALDAKRRMVLVRRDDREHLLILGASTESVVETNITPSPEVAPEFTTTLNDAAATKESAEGQTTEGHPPKGLAS